jgi:hypothetical protein
MDAGINNIIYMELHSGPKMANSTCRKTVVAGTIDQGSTVIIVSCYYMITYTLCGIICIVHFILLYVA